MRDFEYYAPDSLKEALFLIDKRRNEAKILAGGTDLITQMKAGHASPAVVIDVKKIPELNRIERTRDGDLFIGAAVSLDKVIAFPLVIESFNMLREACSLIGSMQLKNRGTVGGNICNAAPSADTAPSLLCLEARVMVAGPMGTRVVPLNSYFLGPGKTIMAANELLVGIEIPPPPERSSGSYIRHIPRMDMDIAVASAASFLVFDEYDNRCSEARIALGAVAPRPFRASDSEAVLAGETLTEEIIETAADLACKAVSPISDLRASAEYRKELVKVLTRRTLKRAWETYMVRVNRRNGIT
jgi:CO/xanthine dehydrogenase FAD-binding subunit